MIRYGRWQPRFRGGLDENGMPIALKPSAHVKGRPKASAAWPDSLDSA